MLHGGSLYPGVQLAAEKIGSAGKPWIEIPMQAAGMAVSVGSAVAVGQALKQLVTSAGIIIVTS